MLFVVSVFPTCRYFDLYHVFRLPVYVCFYKISLETVDFLIQISPVCSYCKVFLCVCVCVCVGVLFCIEKIGDPDVFVCCVVQYWPKTYPWIFLGGITFKRDGKILNLFQDMGGLRMRLKFLYAPPVIRFYPKLHGLSRARNESIAEGEHVRKCTQRVTMLDFTLTLSWKHKTCKHVLGRNMRCMLLCNFW